MVVGSSTPSAEETAHSQVGCPAGDEAVGGGVDDDASQTANVLETEPLVKSDFESVNALPSGTYGTANGYFPSGWGATVFLPATVTMTVAALCAPASALPALSLAIAAGAFPQTAECPTGDEWTDGGITQSGSQVITVASTPTGSSARPRPPVGPPASTTTAAPDRPSPSA
jgi:hypothetical protein